MAATTYTIYKQTLGTGETLHLLASAEASSPAGALREVLSRRATELPAGEADGAYVVIPASNIHEITVKAETRTQLTLT